MKGVKRRMLNKKDRLLAIFYRAISGETLYIKELAVEYEVSYKTIIRDLDVIKSFLAENQVLVGGMQLLRNADKGYRLALINGFHPEELLVVIKILFGSRVLGKKTLNGLMKKLMFCTSGKEIVRLKNACKDEMKFYRQAGNDDSGTLIKHVWELERLLREGWEVSVTYKRLDGKTVERTLYPIAVICSGYYFYLLACRADKEDSSVIYYRVDRIETVSGTDKHMPMDIAERQKKEASRLYEQNMFMGEMIKIRFLYTGPSVQAVLDRFPTAKILRRDEKGVELSAIVEYGKGTLMKLMEQGNWVKVLAPEKVAEDMREELKAMYVMYET